MMTPIKARFAEFDLNKDGGLDKKELAAALSKVKLAAPESEGAF